MVNVVSNVSCWQELLASSYLKDPSHLAGIEPQLSQPKPKEPPPVPPPAPIIPTAQMMSGPPPGSQPHMTAKPPLAPGLLPSPAQLMMMPPPATAALNSGIPTPPMVSMQTPAVPQFSYSDINVTSMSGLAPHIIVNEQVE